MSYQRIYYSLFVYLNQCTLSYLMYQPSVHLYSITDFLMIDLYDVKHVEEVFLKLNYNKSAFCWY